MPRGRPKKQIAATDLVASAEPQKEAADATGEDERSLSDYPMCDRENADKIVGRKALVQLGAQYGMLICQMMEMSLDKLRQQIKYAQTMQVTNEWLEMQESAV